MKTLILAAAALSSGLGAFIVTAAIGPVEEERQTPKAHICWWYSNACRFLCEPNEGGYWVHPGIKKDKCTTPDGDCSYMPCTTKIFTSSDCQGTYTTSVINTPYCMY